MPAADLEDELRAAQGAVVASLLPPLLVASMMSAALIGVALLSRGWLLFPLLWTGTVCAICGGALYQLRALRVRLTSRAPSERLIGRFARDSMIMALPWAALPIVVNPATAPGLQSLVSVAIAAQTCAGLFAMASVPSAAILFSGIVIGGRLVQIAVLPSGAAISELAFMAMYSGVLLVTLRCTFLVFLNWVSSRHDVMALGAQAEERASEQAARRRDAEQQAGRFQWG